MCAQLFVPSRDSTEKEMPPVSFAHVMALWVNDGLKLSWFRSWNLIGGYRIMRIFRVDRPVYYYDQQLYLKCISVHGCYHWRVLWGFIDALFWDSQRFPPSFLWLGGTWRHVDVDIVGVLELGKALELGVPRTLTQPTMTWGRPLETWTPYVMVQMTACCTHCCTHRRTLIYLAQDIYLRMHNPPLAVHRVPRPLNM